MRVHTRYTSIRTAPDLYCYIHSSELTVLIPIPVYSTCFLQDWYQPLAVTDDTVDLGYTTKSDDDSELCAYCFEVVKEVEAFEFNYNNGGAKESTLYPAGDDFEEITCGGLRSTNPATSQPPDPPTPRTADPLPR